MRVVWLRLFTAFQIIQNNLQPGNDGRKNYNRYAGGGGLSVWG
jgi:hypothetical protein